MAELKECPFCGGEAAIYGVDSYYVACCRCEARTARYRTAQEAIAAWNRRPSPSTAPLTLDELKDTPVGTPIWICKKDCPSSKDWDDGAWHILQESVWKKVLGDFEEYFPFEGCCYSEDYGKTWLAYRAKPEED